jgi:Enoyl-CoA hydratase/isomerase
MSSYQHILLDRAGETARITMNRPSRRNSLSADHLGELLAAVREVAASDATGLVLAGAGPVFSAGHDFADVAARDLMGVRDLLIICTDLMRSSRSGAPWLRSHGPGVSARLLSPRVAAAGLGAVTLVGLALIAAPHGSPTAAEFQVYGS